MRDGDPTAGEDDGLILFDGICVFCSGWVRFVVRHDRARRFRFLPIQSERGRDMAVRLGIDPDHPASNAVILDGRVWFRSSAALKVLGALPVTRWTRIGWLAPRPLRDLVYRPIARHRYRLFGRTETCMVPSPEDRARFLS